MKGISALFSVVLIIVFTISIAALIFGFLSENVKQTTQSIGNTTSLAVNCASASISVEDVYVSGTGNVTVRVVVKNTGFADNLVVQDAQVYNKTGSNFSTNVMPLTNFNRGNIATLVFNNVSFSGIGCPQGFSKAIVTTNCGSVFDTFDGTPKC